MSAKISGTFLRAALGPIQYAAGLVTSNKVLQGIEELGAAGLHASLKRGLSEVSALVGIPVGDVERMMPFDQIEEVARRLEQSQPAAIQAWKLHAGQFGFMDVITALTIDGRKAEIGRCLERVAKKVAADKELSDPLLVLAADVTAWEELIVRCRHILEDRDWLARAYAKKRLVRILGAAVPIAVIVASLSLILFVKLRRDRVERALATPDPCAVTVDAADLRFASKEQERSLAGAKTRCEVNLAARKKALEEEERKKLEERKEAEAKEARLRGCAKLAESVGDGSFTAGGSPVQIDSTTSALLGRIATHRLEPSDTGPDDPALPCADTPSAPEFEAAFSAALVPDVPLWAQRTDPSPLTQRSLEAKKAELAANALIGLASTAERSAKDALTSGKGDEIARAKRQCALAKSLGTPGRVSCNAVEKL